ncbi:MAG: 4-hydroxy-3-methylbut-2-enyl diphosphate reductase, partial [Desulfobacterales bacterium]|nr:4-hydroxy-3-methylbut-2-enyl diphosphate reductase [Desulfobacterales bacterium]
NAIPERGSGTILIRAHGVPPDVKENLRKVGFDVVDATCPRVIKVQSILKRHAKHNYASIILGNQDHPEVVGLLGYAGENGYVISSTNDLNSLPRFEKAIIVAQTTQNTLLFDEIEKLATEKFPHYKVFNTICDSTGRRQAEVKRLASSVDSIIVVGGFNSGNTQRLAEIAKKTGKSAYHIEMESDFEKLDLKPLVSSERIGITAGASTPNWTIKRVYRALEALSFKKGRSLRKLCFSIQRTMLLTNIYVSIGAGSLCYACTMLQGISRFLPYVIISILYVQSMHILNHLTGSESDRYNDPERASFYKKHKFFLTSLAVISGSAGLITAYTMGPTAFLILFIMSLLGLSYNLRLLPSRFTGNRYFRIRDIPGSKTFLIAVAWGIVTSILPPLSASGKIGLSAGLIFLWSTSLVFVRTAFFDILDMQGDRIVGKETLATLLGEIRTMRLLKVAQILGILLLVLSAVFGLISNLGFVLLICPVSLFFILLAYERGFVLPGIRLEFLIETLFPLAGVVAFVWWSF